MSALEVVPQVLSAAAPRVRAAASDVRSAGAQASASCLDTGDAALSAALGAFDARLVTVTSELAAAGEGLAGGLLMAARAYVAVDTSVVPGAP